MLKRSSAVLATVLSLLVGTAALAADNYTITSGGQQRTVGAKDVGGVLFPRSIATDSSGAERFTTANPGFVTLPSGATIVLSAGSAAIGSVTVSNLPATQPVSAAALPLPAGAATSANQTAANTSLASIDGKVPALVSGRTPVDGSGVTQPVSAASLPLPTGAATAAKQAQPGTAGTASADVLTIQGATGGVPIPTIGTQASSLGTGQVSCGTTATQVVAARTGRRNVVLIQEGTTLVRIGAASVTTTTGVPLPGTAYAALSVDGGAAVSCITATGTQTISYLEVY